MSEFEKLLDSFGQKAAEGGRWPVDCGCEQCLRVAGARTALLAHVAALTKERDELKRQSLAPAVAAVCLKPTYAELQQQLAELEAARDAHNCLYPKLESDLAKAREALTKAATFIEYARYELEDGKAVLGDQFPRKDDADEMLAKIQSALTPGGNDDGRK